MAVGMAGDCFVLQEDGRVTLFVIISVPQFLVSFSIKVLEPPVKRYECTK